MRIHITGASGSGCTTLGQALASRLSIPLLDTDDYFWHPTVPLFQKKRQSADRNTTFAQDLANHPRCVVSGSVMLWESGLDDVFDLIVFLHVPDQIRMTRLVTRETARFGTPDPEFIEWAGTYETADLTTRSRALHEWWLAQRQCRVLRLEGDFTVEENLAALLPHVNSIPTTRT